MQKLGTQIQMLMCVIVAQVARQGSFFIIFAIYIPIGRKVFCIFAKNVSTWEDNLCGTMITGLYSFSFI